MSRNSRWLSLVFISIVVTSHAAFAEDIVEVYPEEGRWVLDVLTDRPGRLPTLKSRQTFPDEASAVKFSESHLGVHPGATLKMFSTTPGFVTEVDGEAIWTAEAEWNWQWEQKFAVWTHENITVDFFKKFNVATDCADVAYAARWIFARIYKLPMASRLGGRGQLFTNESMREEWVRLPTSEQWFNDRRFRAALNYVLDLTYTHTLFADSYPVAIRPDVFLEGVFHLAKWDETGHTQLVTTVDTTGNHLPVMVHMSTVPRDVRDLMAGPFIDYVQPVENQSGFLRQRWPVKLDGRWALTAARSMPGYSLEQYQPEFVEGSDNFGVAVFKRINPNFDPIKRVTEGLKLVVEQVRQREKVVADGWEFCKRNDCAPGSAGYENWSTPSRDKRMASTFDDLVKFVKEIEKTGVTPGISNVWQDTLQDTKFDVAGKNYSLLEVFRVWQAGAYSSEPNVAPEFRWGLTPNAYVTNLFSEVGKLIEARERKLTGNPCANAPASCAPGSPLYIQWQTYVEDMRIQGLSRALSTYCQRVDETKCEEFKRIISERTIVVGGEKITFEEVMKRAFLLNSDPRVAPMVRAWNGGGLQSLWLEGQLLEVQSSDSGFALVEYTLDEGSTGRFTVVDLDTMARVLDLPEDADTASINPKSAEVLFTKSDLINSELFVVNLDSSLTAEKVGKVRGRTPDISWVRDDRAIIHDEDDASIWESGARKLYDLNDKTGAKIQDFRWLLGHRSPTDFVYAAKLTKVGYLNLAESEIKFVEVEGLDRLTESILGVSNESILFIAIGTEGQGEALFVLDRKTNSAEELLTFPTINWLTHGWLAATWFKFESEVNVTQAVSLLRFDSSRGLVRRPQAVGVGCAGASACRDGSSVIGVMGAAGDIKQIEVTENGYSARPIEGDGYPASFVDGWSLLLPELADGNWVIQNTRKSNEKLERKALSLHDLDNRGGDVAPLGLGANRFDGIGALPELYFLNSDLNLPVLTGRAVVNIAAGNSNMGLEDFNTSPTGLSAEDVFFGGGSGEGGVIIGDPSEAQVGTGFYQSSKYPLVEVPALADRALLVRLPAAN